jgi:hypothetical protein
VKELFICLENEEGGDYNEDDRYENKPLCRRHELMAAIGADTDVEVHILLAGGAGFHRGQFIPEGFGMSTGQKTTAPQWLAEPPVVCLELAEGAKALCESKLR